MVYLLYVSFEFKLQINTYCFAESVYQIGMKMVSLEKEY